MDFCSGIIMKSSTASAIILVVLAGLLFTTPLYFCPAQSMSTEEIRNNLLNNPPNTGDPMVRKHSILALDSILCSDSACTAQSVFNLYTSMMEKVKTELRSKIDTGASIWLMYNDGYIVKTPEIVFAFDVIGGYSGWNTQLPLELIDQIKVLFISHNHSDHVDATVIHRVIANGGFVVVPAENSDIGNVSMAINDSLTLQGLRIKAFYGLHNVPMRIYEVTTPSGLKFLHTGDNQTSETLPDVLNLDVLLLNAWVNESGLEPASVGMTNCVNKLEPKIMIPGHIQELGHDYIPGDPKYMGSRVSYQAIYQIQDSSVASKTHTMIWGESYILGEDESLRIDEKTQVLPQDFQLFQNFPNPFNPSTTIQYGLPLRSFVRLVVYNILGQVVKELINTEQQAGYQSVVWDANVASGLYFYRLEATSTDDPNKRFIDTKKMLLLK
jgi:L-ascorbate metabolism protein UlaG (beta-lactamase superfamily)